MHIDYSITILLLPYLITLTSFDPEYQVSFTDNQNNKMKKQQLVRMVEMKCLSQIKDIFLNVIPTIMYVNKCQLSFLVTNQLLIQYSVIKDTL